MSQWQPRRAREAVLTMLRNVTVCSSCKRASCCQRVFPCATPSRALLLPIETLRELDRELPEFWTEEWADAAKKKPASDGATTKETA